MARKAAPVLVGCDASELSKAAVRHARRNRYAQAGAATEAMSRIRKKDSHGHGRRNVPG